MVPLDLFGHRAFVAANILTFLLYFSLSAVLFYLPMTIISAWDVSALEAAAAFAPLPVFIGALSTTVGAWADRIGPRALIAAGAAFAALVHESGDCNASFGTGYSQRPPPFEDQEEPAHSGAVIDKRLSLR